MADSYATELRDIIDRAFVGEYSGRATAQMVHNSVHRDLPEHLVDYLIGKGLRSQIGSYFRERDGDGLPKRPEANPDGIHADIALLSLDEFEFVHDRYVDQSDAMRQQAERVRVRCMETHGVDLAARRLTS